jgi:diguanylate cyclase (GGDEF)-like protein
LPREIARGEITLAGGDYIVHVSGITTPKALIGDKNVRHVRVLNLEGASADLLITRQLATGVLLPVSPGQQSLTLHLSSTGISRLSVHGLSADQARTIERSTTTIGALFIGGLCLLGLYAAVVSLVTRDRLLGAYTLWVGAALAMGVISAGYDLIFLPVLMLPPATEGLIKAVLCALCTLATPMLFRTVFGTALASSPWRFAIDTAFAIGALGFVLALSMPTAQFLQIFWAITSISMLLLTGALAKVLATQRSVSTLYYAAGWAIQLLAVTYHVLGGIGMVERSSTPAFVPAGALTTFLIGIAVADALRTERAGRLAALQAETLSKQALATVISSSPAGMLSFDAQGRLTASNPAAHAMLGTWCTPQLTLTQLLRLAQSSVPVTQDNLEKLPSDFAPLVLNVVEPGEQRYISASLRQTGPKVEAALLDVTASVQMQRLLRAQAYTDPLTGAGNRRALLEQLEHILDRPVEAHRSAILLANVARFRDINTFFGEAAGDALLCEVSTRFASALAGHATFRLAGDQFVAIVTEAPSDLAALAGSLHSRLVAHPISHRQSSLPLNLQIVCQGLSSYSDAAEAIASSQKLIDAVRRSGKTVEAFGADNPILRAWALEQSYSQLIRADRWRDRVSLYAQPLISLVQSEAPRFEVLLRIREGDRMVSPGAFLQAAEELGAMPQLDLYVVEQTLLWIEHLAIPPPYVTCNLSGASFSDQRFAESLMGLLSKHRRSAKHLCVELTESVVVSDTSRAAALFTSLNSLGVRIALDDFGQGYTNFSYLLELPVQVLKLDGSFITNLSTSAKHRAVVQMLVQLAHSLEMQVVAEWVEDVATLRILQEMDVDVAQGWVFAKAKPFNFWDTRHLKALEITTTALLQNPRVSKV